MYVSLAQGTLKTPRVLLSQGSGGHGRSLNPLEKIVGECRDHASSLEFTRFHSKKFHQVHYMCPLFRHRMIWLENFLGANYAINLLWFNFMILGKTNCVLIVAVFFPDSMFHSG